jgi:hypothetical protein
VVAPHKIVTREELRQRIWPGNTFVDYELALKKAVNRLHELRGDFATSLSVHTSLFVPENGGGVWKSNPPFRPLRTESPALKAGEVTGPLSPPGEV